EEPVGDASHQPVQIGHGRGEHGRREGGRLDAGAGLPQHRARAASGRLGGELQAVRLSPAQREEQAPGAHVAAVEGEIEDLRRGLGHGHDAVEKPHERYAQGAHGATLACTSAAAGTFCRSSGGTSMRRRAPDITLAKTGAATWPPWCRSPLGSSMTTTVASLGCDAGTRPANTAM